MMCPVCGSDTSVKDTRLIEGNVIRRRRVCENGHRTPTFESTANMLKVIEARRRAERAYKERNPGWAKRDHLRRQARKEAKKTGEPVESIYQRWGVA